MTTASKTIAGKDKPREPLAAKAKREIAAMAAMPDREIDDSDIPELAARGVERCDSGQVLSPD